MAMLWRVTFFNEWLNVLLAPVVIEEATFKYLGPSGSQLGFTIQTNDYQVQKRMCRSECADGQPLLTSSNYKPTAA